VLPGLFPSEAWSKFTRRCEKIPPRISLSMQWRGLSRALYHLANNALTNVRVQDNTL
jgi:hypothetical protein